MMKITKKYKNEQDFKSITMEEAIQSIETDGYYKKGTIEEVYKSGGGLLMTPVAIYKIEGVNK